MPCRGLFFLQFIAASEHAYGMCDDKTHVPRDLTFIISNIYLKNLPFKYDNTGSVSYSIL